MSVAQVSTLKGHKNTINAIDVSKYEDKLVLTGSDDKTVRIFDARSNKAIKCIANCFSEGVTAVAFDKSNSNVVYCAETTSLYAFDTRSERVMIAEHVFKKENFAADDISTIRAHANGRQLAVGDDSGIVSVVDLESMKVTSSLSRTHKSIVGTLAFRPNKERELATGGFDCISCIWDSGTGKAKQTYNFSDRNLSKFSGQFFNPPFVQSVAFLDGGNALACGLGDGSIQVLDPDNGTIAALEQEAHNAMLNSIACCDNYFLTGGVDQKIHAWELTTKNAEEVSSLTRAASQYLVSQRNVESATAAVEPREESPTAEAKEEGAMGKVSNEADSITEPIPATSLTDSGKESKKKKKSKKSKSKAVMETLDDGFDDFDIPTPVRIHKHWSHDHSSKISILAMWNPTEDVYSGSMKLKGNVSDVHLRANLLDQPFYVVDVTSDVSVYKMLP